MITLGGGLMIKSPRKLSRIVIDSDKAWPTPWVDTHAVTWPATLTSWNYRKKITLAGSTGLLSNYQIRFRIYNDRGPDIPASNTIYTQGVCQSQFQDLRFTNAAGVILPYYIEPSYGFNIGSWCYIWVKVDSIAASPATTDIYMYFGNDSAVSAASATNTFEAFDNFDDGNLTGWTEQDPIATNWSAIAAAMKDGIDGAQGQLAAAGAGGILTWDAATFENCLIEAWIRIPDADTLADVRGGLIYAWNDNTHYYSIVISDIGATEATTIYEVTTSRNTKTGEAWAAGTWYKLRVRAYKDGANLVIAGDVNDVNKVNYTDATPQATPARVGLFVASTNLSRVWADTFFVAKYANPVPTISAVQTWEAYKTAYGVSNITQVAAGMARGDIPVHDGTVINKISPGATGQELASQGPGNPLTWIYPP